MANKAIYTVRYRRKREGKTHYKKRLELLKSNLPRLVIRRSNKIILLQLVCYEPDGDKVLVAFSSKKLSGFGWNYSKKSLPASYLTGLAFGTLAKKAHIEKAILDLGLQTPLAGSRVYAALQGVVDAGVQVPCSEEVFPSQERVSGEHIAHLGDHAKKCTAYEKEGLLVADIPKTFEQVKEKILS